MTVIKGSHNTFTYHKPRNWYMNLFSIFAKCQNKNLYEQVFYKNVNAFDLRIRVNKNGKIYISHGLYILKPTLYEILIQIESILLKFCGRKFYLRILLENHNPNDKQKKLFRNICSNIERKLNYRNITIFGGYDKSLKEEIFIFEENRYLIYKFEEFHASVANEKFIDKILKHTPKLFDIFNQKRKENWISKRCKYFIDFV